MAIGLGRMFGIKLPINFNSPYQATNIGNKSAGNKVNLEVDIIGKYRNNFV